ncbi:MAG: hypothetical protein Q4G33_08050 [bacterium]|nr:hypothetical protein [bacterium]
MIELKCPHCQQTFQIEKIPYSTGMSCPHCNGWIRLNSAGTENNNSSKKSGKVSGIILKVIVCAAIAGGLFFVYTAKNSPQKNDTNNTPGIKLSLQTATPKSTAAPTAAPTPYVFNNADYEKGVAYESLARVPDGFVGLNLGYNGTVIQIQESNQLVEMRLAVNNDYNSIIYAIYNKNIVAERVLEGDNITIYGSFDGLYTYTAVFGNNITIPKMTLHHIDRN